MIQYSSANIRMWSRLGPSGAFGAAALELGESRMDTIVISADMSFASGIERFRAKYPERHYEVGIAEQNLIGVAAGIASEGFTPYVTTYATFMATRAMDQVKMCLGYMKQNVKMVGVMAGLSAGILGPTHMGIEDISIMRAVPNITILSPADTTETVKALLAAADLEGPCYIRLTGEMNQPVVYTEDYSFVPGRAIQLRDGKDISIFATGTMVYEALQVAENLMETGISCRVIDMHTIKPLDKAAIDQAGSSKIFVSMEEHSVLGGLGGAIAEHLSQGENTPPLLRIGIEDFYPHAGSHDKLFTECRLTVKDITTKIRERYLEIGR